MVNRHRWPPGEISQKLPLNYRVVFFFNGQNQPPELSFSGLTHKSSSDRLFHLAREIWRIILNSSASFRDNTPPLLESFRESVPIMEGQFWHTNDSNNWTRDFLILYHRYSTPVHDRSRKYFLELGLEAWDKWKSLLRLLLCSLAVSLAASKSLLLSNRALDTLAGNILQYLTTWPA